jgi:hypothetical protein
MAELRVAYLFRVLLAARLGIVLRNEKDCCWKSRGSDKHPHRAHRTPSRWAARECMQISHFFIADEAITLIQIKNGADDASGG